MEEIRVGEGVRRLAEEGMRLLRWMAAPVNIH
jgi:hypothetical protein